MKRKFMLLILLAGVLTSAASFTPRALAQDTPQRIEVTAKRFAFSPGEITLKKGQPVVLVLTSADVAHGISFRELNINVKAAAGKTAEVQFTPEKAGDFIGHCSVFCGSGHGSMIIKLHVVD